MHALVRGAGAIKRVKIIDSDFGQSAEWKVNKKIAEVNHTFWASPWGANLGANITVKAWDKRENKVEISKWLYGPVGQTIEELWSLLPAWLRHGLQRLARAAAQAVSVIGSWILQQFMSGFSSTMSSAKSVVSSLIEVVVLDIAGIYEGKVSFAKFIRDIMSSQVFIIILGFVVGLTVLNYIIMATGIGAAILAAISAALLVAVGVTAVSMGISFALNPTNNILKGWIRSILGYISNKLDNSRVEINIKGNSDDKLFEEISWFVLPLFWFLSGVAAESEALIAIVVGLDLASTILGMEYYPMNKYGFNKTYQAAVIRGMMASVVGGIICTGISIILSIDKPLSVLFDSIVIFWSFLSLYLLWNSYINITSNPKTNMGGV